MIEDRTCPICGGSMRGRRSDALTCSTPCSRERRRRLRAGELAQSALSTAPRPSLAAEAGTHAHAAVFPVGDVCVWAPTVEAAEAAAAVKRQAELEGERPSVQLLAARLAIYGAVHPHHPDDEREAA